MRHAGSSLRHVGSFVAACGLFIEARGLLSSCGAPVPERVGSVVCGTRALVEARELSSGGARA